MRERERERVRSDDAFYPCYLLFLLCSRKSRVSGSLSLKFLYYNNPPPRAGAGINNLGESTTPLTLSTHKFCIVININIYISIGVNQYQCQSLLSCSLPINVSTYCCGSSVSVFILIFLFSCFLFTAQLVQGAAGPTSPTTSNGGISRQTVSYL